MRRRWLLLVVAVAAMAATAGCTGTGGVSDQQLAQNATYDWGANAAANATVYVNATGGHYRAVVNVTGANKSTLTFAQRSELGGTNPIPISAVQFRYQNGTVVNASTIQVSQSSGAVTVTLPDERGQFAYTAPTGSRSFAVPVVLSKVSYEVVLPTSMRTDIPIVASVSPGGYERTVSGDRVHLHWSRVTAETVSVQYYLLRDVLLFGGLLALGALIAIGGVVYYRRQIRRLEREREEQGLDVRD